MLLKSNTKLLLAVSHSLFQTKFQNILVCTCPIQKIEVNSTTTKIFTSPGYPLEYCDDIDCRTRITAVLDNTPPEAHGHQFNTVVQIRFNAFLLETDVDFLQLIDKIPLLK